MKKFLFLLIMIIVLAISVHAEAGQIFYEKGDLKVSIEEASACMLYDFKAEETLAGMKTPIVQYKKFNFDVGVIGDYDDFREIDAFVGLSYDIKAFEFNDNLYADVGVFASPGILDDGEVRYGVCGGLAIKF